MICKCCAKHLNPNHQRLGSRPSYIVYGFLYVFKVGIPTPGVIPWTVAYPRSRRLLSDDCAHVLDVTNISSPQRDVTTFSTREC
uniref:Uncharacterized protein n=1 Tax=Lactuca sativa TaxID=4236 RepID=A0A9R1XY06_LACSA|nr:hypothetical protein LSAT_V11C100004430 [Lactuca sativa]